MFVSLCWLPSQFTSFLEEPTSQFRDRQCQIFTFPVFPEARMWSFNSVLANGTEENSAGGPWEKFYILIFFKK